MVAYFRSYKVISYAISFGLPLLVIAVCMLFGVNLLGSVYGGVFYVVCMLVLMVATSRYFVSRADREAERMLALYNEGCDPQEFVDQAVRPATAAYEQAFRGGTTELCAWFLAPYALAVADTGESDDAAMMEEALLGGIAPNVHPLERAGILLNVEPLTLRLHGPEEALKLATEARELFEASDEPDASSDPALGYLAFEIPLLQALVDGDAEEMCRRFESVWRSESNPMRMRVLDADAAASVYASRGDAEARRSALQFVVDHGNALPVVESARAALAAS